VLHVDDRQYDAFGQKSASVVLDGETFRGRHWMKHADGSNVPTEHIVTAVRLIEGRMAVVSFIKNLTENEESDFAARLTRLTPRETEVFNLTAKGYSAKHLADELKITLRTAEAHRAAVLEKLGYSSTNELLGDLISSKSKHGL
jgi:DNA-binding NarL/FixJ family response regulator